MIALTPQERLYLAAYFERYDVAAILAESGDPVLTPTLVRARILRLWRAERDSSVRAKDSGPSTHSPRSAGEA